jgi:hypothetical protein
MYGDDQVISADAAWAEHESRVGTERETREREIRDRSVAWHKLTGDVRSLVSMIETVRVFNSGDTDHVPAEFRSAIAGLEYEAGQWRMLLGGVK